VPCSPWEYCLIISEFYATLAQISFTLLGFWFVVVQMRRDEWSQPAFRVGALAVILHLAMPGMMSLLDLADPQDEELWRVAFIAFAALGLAGVLLLLQRAPSPTLLTTLAHWGAIVLYALVAVVAIFAEAVESAFDTEALQVEAVLLSLLILLSLNMAVSMVFGAGDDRDGAAS
jgi:hypothetical protein